LDNSIITGIKSIFDTGINASPSPISNQFGVFNLPDNPSPSDSLGIVTSLVDLYTKYPQITKTKYLDLYTKATNNLSGYSNTFITGTKLKLTAQI
jgi:hypothetical protein